GRRVLVAWGRVNLPGMPFNQMMNFPIELTLHETDEGLRLFTWPIRESAQLQTKTTEQHNLSVSAGGRFAPELQGELFDVDAKVSTAGLVEFDVRGVRVTFDARKGELSCLDRKAAIKPGELHLRLLVDRASIEVFANGQVYMP